MRYRSRWLVWAWSALALCACTRSHSASESSHPSSTHADAGASGADGERSGKPGTKAIAQLEPVADAAPDSGRPSSGTGRFMVTQNGVDLWFMLDGCPSTAQLRLFIQQGADCSADTLAGPHWNGAHGEGIPDVPCIGVIGQGRAAITRANDDAAPWTIGDSSASDLLGHALVAYDKDSGKALACGVIMLDESAPAVPGDARAASDVALLGRAQVAGLCLGQSLVRDNTQPCPDPNELSACAQEHCQLDRCVATCADYLACTGKAEDPCSVAYSCEIDQDCSSCQGAVQMCVLTFCSKQISCAAPATPDGPCSQLRACCAMQGDMAESCLALERTVEQLSGDPSCFGLMHDREFVAHLSMPCMFE